MRLEGERVSGGDRGRGWNGTLVEVVSEIRELCRLRILTADCAAMYGAMLYPNVLPRS